MPLRSFKVTRLQRSAAVLLFVSGLALAVSLYGIVRTQGALDALAEAHTAAEAYLSGLKDIETAYRGFVIVGTGDYLDPFRDALGRFNEVTKRLQTTATDARVPADLVAQTRSAGDEVVAFAQTVIDARSRDAEQARELVRLGRGKALMDRARDLIGRMQAEWNARLNRLQDRDLPVSYWAAALSMLGLLAGGWMLLLAARAANRTSSIARALVGDVIEKAPVGLVLLDAQQRVAQHNSTFARLFDVHATIGRPFAQVAPALFEHVRRDVTRAMKSRPGAQFDASQDSDTPVFQAPKDDQPRFYKTTVFPIAVVGDEGSEECGAGIIVDDVTREREREMELQSAKDDAEGANRAKSAFIANMSHELRTPLTAVLGYSELLEDELADRGETALLADVSKIGVNARHLLSLINNVLDLSKIEAEKMDVSAVDCDLGKLVEDVVSATGGLVAGNDNTLVVAVSEQAVTLHTDELKVKQILLNLLGNAAKFTTHGTIRLAARVELESGVDWVRFDVSDTGVGMSEEQISRLFQRFAQADETTTRQYGGTGLGLALTRALATLIGGTISVRSEVGAGSTFTLLFPARYSAIVAATAAGVGPDDEAAKPEGSGPLVLVVDDEPSAREFLTRHLKREGFSVITASRGVEALLRARNEHPAAVLLDVMMPGIDGWHVLRSLKADSATADIPVIVQTVLDDNGFARLMGASGYLQKPVARNSLAQMLADVVPEPGSRRALVMADDAGGRDELREELAADGWQVALAADTASALAELQAARPNLLIVDLTMAERAGFVLLREVRQRPEWNAVAIVAITPVDFGAERMHRLKADAIRVVDDTVTMSDLVAELRRHHVGGAAVAAAVGQLGRPAASPEAASSAKPERAP